MAPDQCFIALVALPQPDDEEFAMNDSESHPYIGVVASADSRGFGWNE